MNCLDDGQIFAHTNAYIEFTNAVNTYLLERGIDKAELPKYWTGERQLTSS